MFIDEALSLKFPLSKICQTYSAIMKLKYSYTLSKKDEKIYKSCHVSLKLCKYQYFFIGNQQLFLYQEIQI